jgi:L-2-hydroxyglutarate oxidase LhgO
VPHSRLGKLIVAANDEQRAKLDGIRAAGIANDVHDLQPIDAAELARLEPAIRGSAALFSPSTGIVDSHALMQALEGDLTTAGGMVVLHAPVSGGAVAEDGIVIDVAGEEPMRLHARMVVNAAGLAAQQVALAIDGVPGETVPQQYLAIGHYYRLSGAAPASRLIYPVPEDGGLGVHLTLDMGGQAKFGPDVRWIDALDYSFDDGHRDAFIAAIRAYLPGIDADRLHADYTGIRPKLSGPRMAAADFRIDGPEAHGVAGLVNLFGIESPGLTASLAIADEVAARLSR